MAEEPWITMDILVDRDDRTAQWGPNSVGSLITTTDPCYSFALESMLSRLGQLDEIYSSESSNERVSDANRGRAVESQRCPAVLTQPMHSL